MTTEGAKDREFGYPHEIISLSTNWAKKVLQDYYRGQRTRMMAYLLLTASGEKQTFTLSDEPKSTSLALLKDLANTLNAGPLSSKTQFVKKMNELIEQNERSKSKPALEELEELVIEYVFFQISLTQHDQTLLDETTINKLQMVLPSSSISYNFLRIITSFMSDNIDEETARGLAIDLVKIEPKEYAIYWSFKFGAKYPKFRNIFLSAHYRLIKGALGGKEPFLYLADVDDIGLHELFRTSLILLYCGYGSTLRLPHTEKVHYMDELLLEPLSLSEFPDQFDKAAKINLWVIEIPIWSALIIVLILIVLGSIPGVLSVTSLSFFGFGADLPLNISLLTIIGAVLLTYVIYSLYLLKKAIIDEMSGVRDGKQ